MDKLFYKKDDITVVWQPKLCIHSGICFHGLPSVFDPKRRPWIITENAEKNAIISQVMKCPSVALSIRKEEKEIKP